MNSLQNNLHNKLFDPFLLEMGREIIEPMEEPVEASSEDGLPSEEAQDGAPAQENSDWIDLTPSGPSLGNPLAFNEKAAMQIPSLSADDPVDSSQKPLIQLIQNSSLIMAAIFIEMLLCKELQSREIHHDLSAFKLHLNQWASQFMSETIQHQFMKILISAMDRQLISNFTDLTAWIEKIRNSYWFASDHPDDIQIHLQPLLDLVEQKKAAFSQSVRSTGQHLANPTKKALPLIETMLFSNFQPGSINPPLDSKEASTAMQKEKISSFSAAFHQIHEHASIIETKSFGFEKTITPLIYNPPSTDLESGKTFSNPSSTQPDLSKIIQTIFSWTAHVYQFWQEVKTQQPFPFFSNRDSFPITLPYPSFYQSSHRRMRKRRKEKKKNTHDFDEKQDKTA